MKKIKKYQGGVPELMTPRMASVKTADVPLVSGTPKQVSIPKPSFMDKAGNFMGNYGGAIAQAAGTLMPLLMKKKDPNERPYKKGSKLIKYQEGNEYLQASKLQKRILEDLDENDNKISYSSVKEEPAEKFDIASLNPDMPDLPRRSPKGSKSPNDAQVGPTRKEAAKLIREYNKKESAKGNLGYLDMDYLERQERQNALMMGDKIEPNVKGKIETLTNKTPLLKLSSTPELPATLKKVPVEKQSRRERRQENKRLTAMAKAPIIYNESSPLGPSNEELQLGRAREEAKLKGTPLTDSLIKKSMSSQAFKDVTSKKSNKYIDFKDMTPTQQKQYRAGIASGKEFTVEGIGKYGAATKQEQSQSARMATKGGNKPLVKMKEDSWTEDQWKNFLTKRNNPVAGQELVRMSNQNPYAMAGFNIPFNQPSKQVPAQTSVQQTKNTQKTNTNSKTAKHTTEDPGKKMVNTNLETVAGRIQKQRELYKKRQEEEQNALRQQGVRYMEKLKKENPEAYNFHMRLNAKREALKGK
jgi:hypothetical protein